jgi:hypothetical protein
MSNDFPSNAIIQRICSQVFPSVLAFYLAPLSFKMLYIMLDDVDFRELVLGFGHFTTHRGVRWVWRVRPRAQHDSAACRQSYIIASSARRLYDEYGNAHLFLDEELRRKLETWLTAKILRFDLGRAA